GWEQGIRRYCTADSGYRAGKSGKAYTNICPADVADDFISGWREGIRRYCTAENGLQHGLAGKHYSGICPANLEPAYRDLYQLGKDVRKARSEHRKLELDVTRIEKKLANEKKADQYRKKLHQLERLKHQESRSDATLISLEACMSSDWFDTGYRDGEDGYPRRAGEIARTCRNYGIGADPISYRQGWQQGNQRYCTYETGLYLGQTNQLYSGVCAGIRHQHFWQGYERGRTLYRADRYEAHPKPKKRVMKQTPQINKMSHRIEEPREKKREQKNAPSQVEHDNWDKSKHPMPTQSQKSELNRHEKDQRSKSHDDESEE
ncbi:MAG TPA: DUF2799 domain-containing protein, partial [Mariprofundaceae bacterium]|nr:DUF2799 domain-containing protein [Mariprofundaceae bacterium]